MLPTYNSTKLWTYSSLQTYIYVNKGLNILLITHLNDISFTLLENH